ncbi:hypothetical protein [Nocardia rhamnosiphila]
MTELPRLRTVRAADVYKSGRQAAAMTKSTDGTLEFRCLKARDWIGFAAEIGLPDRGAASARAVALRAAEAVDYGRLPFTGSPVRKVERELGFRRSELQRL